MAGPDFRALFDAIVDPRVQRTRRHRLTDVLMLVLIGTVCGCKGWDEIEDYGHDWEDELREVLGLPGGIPSADTLRRVMAAVDPVGLGRALTAWTEALCETLSGKQVAIDGKSVRGTLEASSGEGALHLVNAWVCEHQMVLGQYATDVKSNEITAIPKLLELLSLRGATVTMDAMGCQKGVARALLHKGADYIFGLKGNQPSLHQEVLEAFDAETCASLAQKPGSYAVTVDKGHGRSEVRRVWVQHDVSWLAQTKEWEGLASLVLVEAERTRRGVTSCERRAYISSLSVSAEVMGARVRGHWHVENRLHWVLDVSFGEDRARIGKKNGAESMSVMRKIAMNLLERAPGRDGKPRSKPMKQGRANRSWSYLLTILSSGGAAEALTPRAKRPRRASPVGG
jgi:predicted transposase YbfD/YdcC